MMTRTSAHKAASVSGGVVFYMLSSADCITSLNFGVQKHTSFSQHPLQWRASTRRVAGECHSRLSTHLAHKLSTYVPTYDACKHVQGGTYS